MVPVIDYRMWSVGNDGGTEDGVMEEECVIGVHMVGIKVVCVSFWRSMTGGPMEKKVHSLSFEFQCKWLTTDVVDDYDDE